MDIDSEMATGVDSNESRDVFDSDYEVLASWDDASVEIESECIGGVDISSGLG